MLATSTHDTKRSEDVRARMVAISEIPHLWRSSIQRWRTLNRRWKRKVDDAGSAGRERGISALPDAARDLADRFFRQRRDDGARRNTSSRLQTYMAKALKEAKMNTSWIQPNEQWDSAMLDFVAKILEPTPKNQFLSALPPRGGRNRAPRGDQFAYRKSS